MQSPQIRDLAAEGIRLTSWCVSLFSVRCICRMIFARGCDGLYICRYVFKFCSPSRSQTLTGRFAYHLGQQTELNLNPQTYVPCSSRLSHAV